MFLPDILQNIITNLRPSGSILSIVEVTGTYTFTVDNLDTLLVDGMFINISDTVGFETVTDGGTIDPKTTTSIQVSNVNYYLKTFDIQSTESIAIPISLGTYTAQAPYFAYTETGVEYATEIAFKEQRNILGESKSFPALYMPSKVNETDLSYTEFEVNNLELFFITYTDLDSDTKTRYNDDMPYLFDFYTKFKKELNKLPKIKHNTSFTHEKETFQEISTNETNTNVSVIICNTSLIYSTNEC